MQKYCINGSISVTEGRFTQKENNRRENNDCTSVRQKEKIDFMYLVVKLLHSDR